MRPLVVEERPEVLVAPVVLVVQERYLVVEEDLEDLVVEEHLEVPVVLEDLEDLVV